MTMQRLVIGLAMTVVGCAGSPGETLRDPVELLGGLRSYESPDQTRARLRSAELTLRPLQGARPDGRTPKYEMKVASLKWRECGQEGVLELSFVNERLYTTLFIPSNLDACVNDLTTRGIITRSPDSDDRRKVYTGESEGQRFVAATDTRLESEIIAWIGRHS
jgi:hypothetical protein